jgi:hypothetical protein
MDPRTRNLLAEQDGVVARRQLLELGVGVNDLARLVRRRELARVHPGVFCDHTGPLSWNQRAWAAVLFGGRSALSHQSAIRAAEGPGRRGARSDDPIAIAVDRQRKVVAPPGVRVHRMAGLEQRVLWNLGPPRVRYEDAAIDVALAEPTDFDALAVLASACQSRRTTARRLLAEVESRERVARRIWLSGVLRDVAEGTCSVLEHGYLHRVERAHGLPSAQRQARATGSVGVVYRDADYGRVVIELDGRLFHDTTEQRDLDFERDLDLAVEGRTAARLSWGQVYGRPCSTAGKVGALLQRCGWRGAPHPCGPDCGLALPGIRFGL